MRLIDKDRLINRIQFLIRLQSRDMFTALDEIDSAPTIDAVEIVRCKDCKKSIPYGQYGAVYCDRTLYHADPDDFCSFGIRKED